MDLKKIKAGDIFFTRNNSIISRAIRLVETGKFKQDVPSHCGIIESVCEVDGKIRIFTLESLFGGTVSGLLENYCRKGTHVWIKRTKGYFRTEQALLWAYKQRFVKYDALALLGIFIRAIMRKLGLEKFPMIKNYLNSKRRFYCSEYVGHYGKKGGVKYWKGDISFWTPYDIYRSKKLRSITHQKF